MEKTQRRSQIARCMVRFNALNSSRPRGDSGQPIILDEKRRCLTVYEAQRPELHRTFSDTDLYRRSHEVRV